jgi:broad specificity phosphatase PhoE
MDLRDALSRFEVDAAYCSDSRRALETARLVAPVVPLVPTSLLRGRHWGVLTGSRRSGATPEYVTRRIESTGPPGSEAWRDVDRRVGDFLRDAALRAAPGRCALVAHGSSLRSLARQVQSDAGPWVHGELRVASWAFSRQGGQRQHVPGRRRLRGRVNES